MSLKVKPITLRERDELEPMLIANPEVIEDGLQIIFHQHPTDTGPLDILAFDSEETLVVVELKNEASDGHLDQGLRYYDWCRQNISWIADAYKGKATINPESPPRLILIAPSYTDTVKRIAKYVDVELQLIEYHAFENEQGERGIICTEIDFGQAPEPPSIPTIEKKLEWFKDEKVRNLFVEALSELEMKGVEIRPIHGLWISFFYRGKRFMHMGPKRTFFVANVLTPGGTWTGRMRIYKRQEWEELVSGDIQEYMEYLESGQN
ncbi:MAG: DUF91 domain-containing protein [Anaerolineales bacterium]|nr:DUF91 domain-containing protein [Anaerolineales bacterium]